VPIELLFGRNYSYIFLNWLHFYVFKDVNILYPVITNCFISSITFFAIYEEINRILKYNARKTLVLMSILTLFPDIILISAQNLKDTILLFLMVLYVKNVIKIVNNNNIYKSLISALIVSLFTFTIRFYIFFIQLIMLLVVLITKNKVGFKKIVLLCMVVLSIVIATHIPSIYQETNKINSVGVTNIFEDYFVFTQNRDNDYFLKSVVKDSEGYSIKTVVLTTASIILTPYFIKIFTSPMYIKIEVISAVLLWCYLIYFILAICHIKNKTVEEKWMIFLVVLITIFHSFTPYLADGRHRIIIIWMMIILSFSESLNHKRIKRIVTMNFSLIFIIALQIIGDILIN